MSKREPAKSLIGIRLVGAMCAVGAWAVAMWFAWFGWARVHAVIGGIDYYGTGRPGSAWQWLGCGCSLAVGVVLTYMWLRRRGSGLYHFATAVLITGVATLAFAITWTRDALQDPTDAFVFLGTIEILIVASVGFSVLLAVTEALARVVWLRRRRS